MGIVVKLYGDSLSEVSNDIAKFLEEISGREVEWKTETEDGLRRIDPTLAMGIATLILSIPGAVISTIQIREHFGRQKLLDEITRLKQRLKVTNTDAELSNDGKGAVDLCRTSSDKLVDFFITED